MTNQLIHESSPYLLQHAHNPVHWYPWCDAAFERAEKEHKPVLVSIGYSACHWCHVMEKESFEDINVAAYMNENFICIKVDREERPDVDHLYMDALQVLSGQGGWPLNMFVTPGRKPFYGGTYFPPQRAYQRASWMEVLEAIHLTWTQKPEDIVHQSDQLVAHLHQLSLTESVQEGLGEEPEYDKMVLDNIMAQADRAWGGFGAAPKFPQTMTIQFLLEHYYFTDSEQALKQALVSIDGLLNGGIYDQLGGGLARYATDNEWLVPHFEKMLYDNALFVQVLSDAYKITKEERYKKAIAATLDFCINELSQNQSGIGFYAALDADSEGEEGKYYTWDYAEIKAVIPELHPALLEYWDITPEGNWEGVTILNKNNISTSFLERHHLTSDAWEIILEDARQHLLQRRQQRVRPLLDHKILLSWNALLCTALVKAASALDCSRYLQLAKENIAWMLDTFLNDGKLYRSYDGEKVKFAASLEDYAYLIKAILVYSSAGIDHAYLSIAKELYANVVDHFGDEQQLFFYFSHQDQKDIIVRKIETYDGALPSVNAVMAENSIILAKWYEDEEMEHRGASMLQAMQAKAMRYPTSFAYWAACIQRYARFNTLSVLGTSVSGDIAPFQTGFHPHVVLMATNKPEEFPVFQGKGLNEETQFYLCTKYACLPSEKNPGNILSKIKQK
ncbi:thioredoxin domain-containing protein [Taibaiella sp. KBW10]|uniref:thioredoxin domain-containing protein n=1 Tax=Taibaiella sp. KBW10 TaxID=2153357 RepID=UPI000F5AECD2|nr:thioredoxin domain-containing protein [Taibaiella sp. KBW10]RQO30060.1 thioredoxin domain-containing protein [Taibaiella sp. KBW10]